MAVVVVVDRFFRLPNDRAATSQNSGAADIVGKLRSGCTFIGRYRRSAVMSAPKCRSRAPYLPQERLKLLNP
jgi:hypothetical protein